MSPTTGIAASQLRQLIYYHLDNNMLENANFIAGRLHAFEPRGKDAAHLLALTYLRMSRYKAAFDYSQKFGAKGDHLGCAYVFAQSCFELGRYADGINALEKARSAWVDKSHWTKHSENSRRHIPDAPAVLTLLAKLYQSHGEIRKAGDCYIEAHKQNPFIWDAFEGLCNIGADLKVENMFKPTSDMPGMSAPGSESTDIYVDEYRKPLSTQPNYGHGTHIHEDVFISRPQSNAQQQIFKQQGKPSTGQGARSAPSDWDATPTAMVNSFDEDVTMAENVDDTFNEPPAAPSRGIRPRIQIEASERPRPPHLQSNRETPDDIEQAPRKSSVSGQKRTISGAIPQTNLDDSQPRRSHRLYTQTTSTRTTRAVADTSTTGATRAERTARTAKAATGAKGRPGAIMGRVVSGNRKVLPPDEKGKEKEKRMADRNSEKNITATVMSAPLSTTALAPKQLQAPPKSDAMLEQEAMSSLLSNFRQLAVGCHASSRFQLSEATQVFRSLPSAQRETPWVLAQLGKAHYEAGEYLPAEECYARLMKMQPSRIEDMEIYSTVLWHLRKESTLAFLCRLLRDNHFDTPQTWVAIGNALSLSREHDQAIAAFKRATQLDEGFAYAWTLMGHEYMANEAFDTALSAFRKAVAIDRRGYGGWYGLGKCYYAMGKLEDAEQHYRIAHAINPSNSTLLVCIGIVLERLRNKPAALAHYSQALELQPTSALARFKKARVLMHLRSYSSALEELQVLHEQAPDEANVHFLLGKCYKGLGERGEALRAFTTALNLDVKAAPFIKEAMDLLNEEDEEESDDD